MKKLLAILFACSMMTCVFTACGEEKKESKSESESSSSSEVSEESSKNEESDKEKSESETEEETEVEEETEETTEESSVIANSDEITNIVDVYWEIEDQPEVAWFAFYPYTDGSNTGYFSTAIDVSDQLSFTKDGNLLFDSTEVPVTKEGNILKASVTGADGTEQVMAEMELIDNTDAFYDTDGIYWLTGGLFYDLMSATTIDSIYLYVNGNTTYCEMDACIYTDDGEGNLAITGDELCSFSSDGSDSTVKYVLDNDTLTLTEENGTVTVLKAID